MGKNFFLSKKELRIANKKRNLLEQLEIFLDQNGRRIRFLIQGFETNYFF